MADNSQAVKPVSQLATASDLSQKLDALRNRRRMEEIEWKLNMRFYQGDQYTYYNPGTRRIEAVPTQDAEIPRYRVRIVSNQIQTGVQSLLSKLIKTKPSWNATPGETGDSAMKAAQFAAELLEEKWSSLNMGSKYEDALLWSIMANEGWWQISWDPFANSQMTFLMTPDGQPITDSAMEKEYRAQLEQAGIDPKEFEKVVYMGDVRVDSLAPTDVYIDDTVKNAADAKWAFCRRYLSVDDINARFPKAKEAGLKPDAVPTALGHDLMGNEGGDPSVKAVWDFYHLPTPSQPKGRVVTFVEDPDTILEDSPWESRYPKLTRLPLVQFRSVKVPGQASGSPLVSQARPLQKQLNRMLSQVTEYFNLTVKPRIWAPMNSLRQRIANEPGAVYEYTPVGNQRPEVEQLSTIPSYVFEFLNQISGRLNEVFGLTEVTEGKLPPNLEAADAIDLLQEMATDRFAPAILENEKSLANAGQILLVLMQQYYVEPRQIALSGPGGIARVREFNQADFAGNLTVSVEAGSSMPKTRAARRKQVERWMELGLIQPQNAWKYFDTADTRDLAVRFARDEDHALREHDKIIRGIPLNPEAAQQAMVAVNQGINPETGEPFEAESMEEFVAMAQQALERASLQPGMADNDGQHAETHSDWLKSMEFESHSPDVRRRAMMHYELTIQKLASQSKQPEPEAQRVSLALKAAPGATAVSEILKAAGVEVPTEVVATEPPLETAVYDSVDKADADAAGPGQEAEQLSSVATALVQAEIANAAAQVENAGKVRQQDRDDEIHAERVRAERAKADSAERDAREKPKSEKR